jgi:hypothetical protein
MNQETQKLLANLDEQVLAIESFRASVLRLKPFYTKGDVERMAGAVYGVDEGIVICPIASANCSQPSVPSL